MHLTIRRSWRLVALGCLLALAAPEARADGWAEHATLCDRALGGYDAAKWQTAHQQLIGKDHPAAIKYILRFYRKQKAYTGDWKNAGGRNLDQMKGDGLRAYYGRLLPVFVNVRSVRFAVEQLEDVDDDTAALLIGALRGRDSLHAADAFVRDGVARAVEADDETHVRRYRALFADRLDIRDIALFEDLPAPETPSAEAAAMNAALDGAGAIHESFVFSAWLARSDDTPAWELVREAYHVRLLTALDLPALRALPELHRAAVALEHRRMLEHDLYLHPKRQRQPFDKKARASKRGDRERTVDFTNNAAAREIRLLTAMRAWLDKRAEGRRLLGPPYHPELFALNAGRTCGMDSIAFTQRDRDRQDLRDEVLAYNQGVRGVHPKERANAALVNAFRADHGLLPLRLDLDLCVSSRRHSAYQRGRGALAHAFPDRREPHGVTPKARMIRAGYPTPYAGGENIYMGSTSPKEAFKAWKKSPPHKRNMLQAYWREIGVGAAGRFWTQNFGTEPYDQDHDAED